MDNFRGYLKLDEAGFESLKAKLDRWLCNFIVVFILALVFVVMLNLDQVQSVATDIVGGHLTAFDAVLVWTNLIFFFDALLLATAIWIVLSIWAGTFQISRQPINFKPVRYSNEFRPMAVFSLKTTAFYFLIITIPALLNLYYSQNIFNLGFFYILVLPGAVGFFAPHYNIHRTLKRERQTELEHLDKEIHHHTTKLRALHLSNTKDLEECVWLSSHIIALQALERRVAEADDWPLDFSIISTFMGLVIIPILVNFVTSPPPGFP